MENIVHIHHIGVKGLAVIVPVPVAVNFIVLYGDIISKHGPALGVVYCTPVKAAGGIYHISLDQSAFGFCQNDAVAYDIFQIIITNGYIGIVFKEFVFPPAGTGYIRIAFIPDSFNRHILYIIPLNDHILKSCPPHGFGGQIASVINGDPVSVFVQVMAHNDNSAGCFSAFEVGVDIVYITILHCNVFVYLFLIGRIDQDPGTFTGTAVHGFPHLIRIFQIRHFQVINFPVLFVVNRHRAGNGRPGGTIAVNQRAAAFSICINDDGRSLSAAAFGIQCLIPDAVCF